MATLQCFCLENPRDGEAWWAAIYGIAQSWTQLNWLSSSSSCTKSSSLQVQQIIKVGFFPLNVFLIKSEVRSFDSISDVTVGVCLLSCILTLSLSPKKSRMNFKFCRTVLIPRTLCCQVKGTQTVFSSFNHQLRKQKFFTVLGLGEEREDPQNIDNSQKEIISLISKFYY